jgi:hypothetical protein
LEIELSRKTRTLEEQEDRDFVPFLLIIWDFKMKVAQNIQSNAPNIAHFTSILLMLLKSPKV